MEQTWRWFGPDDPVTLEAVKQAGATGVVTALHDLPLGDVWPLQAIRERQRCIEASGLTWSVVESIPVHEEIKYGGPRRQELIDNYKRSLRHVGACGIDTVCYNFMPVLDWSRTELRRRWSDSSEALAFDAVKFAAFDLFILQRPDARSRYSEEDVARARAAYEAMTAEERADLCRNLIAGMPGRMVEAYSNEQFTQAIERYRDVDTERARENLFHFLREVIPVAAEAGVRMAIHPDDPPMPLLGLPRVVSTEDDLKRLLAAVDSPYNGLTMCVGSYASRPDNDVEGMVERLADRIHFVHLRNVRKEPERSAGALTSFVESDHLNGDVDMYRVVCTVLREQQRRRTVLRQDPRQSRLPFRPDHGHAMLDDLRKSQQPEHGSPRTNPGYTAIGRLRGLAELRGLEMGIRRSGVLDAQ